MGGLPPARLILPERRNASAPLQRRDLEAIWALTSCPPDRCLDGSETILGDWEQEGDGDVAEPAAAEHE